MFNLFNCVLALVIGRAGFSLTMTVTMMMPLSLLSLNPNMLKLGPSKNQMKAQIRPR